MSSRSGGSSAGERQQRPRTVILDLGKHVDSEVHVKFTGGRQVRGILKGWDPLVNLVLDEAIEEIRDSTDPYKSSGKERKLGLVVARGTSVMTISPLKGMEVIENPFKEKEEQI